MKLSLKLILLFQLVIFHCLSQNNKRTIYEYDKTSNLNLSLKGQVKYLKEVSEYMLSKNNKEIEYFFDKNGLPTKIIKKSLALDITSQELRDEKIVFEFENGKLTSKLNKIRAGLDGYTYTFDNKGNRIQEKFYVQNRLVSEELYEYDDRSRLIKSTDYVYGYLRDYIEETPQNKSKYISVIETFGYDGEDNVVLETMNNIKGNIYKKKIYKYDSMGNMVEEGKCENYSGIDSKIECNYSPLLGWEYNENNQSIREFQLAKFSPHNTDTYYKYDEQGNEIEALGYYIYPEKEPVIGYLFNYEYNDSGRKTKDIEVVGKYRKLGFERYKTEIIKFDKYQNIVLKEFITSDDKIIKVLHYIYLYDSKGNWTEQIKEEGKTEGELKVTETKKRNIEYYN